MADKESDGPSLELPSLGFGRKRGKRARGTDAVPADQTPHEAPAPAPVPASAPVAPELVEEPAAERVAAPEPVAQVDAETTVPPSREERPTTHLPPVPPPEPAAPLLFADEVQGSPTRFDAPVVSAAPPRAPAKAPVDPRPERPRREFRLPALSGMTAALITGAVAGVLMVGLTGLGFRLCEVIQGAPSCGDPGFLLLLAIVIVVILVGKALLAAWTVPDPGSTSFLAVGLLCVVALLFLVEVLFNWWMIIVIPVLGMLCFALSHWVTTAFVDRDE